MSLSHEALLMLLALGLYVYDALMLLDSNELLLVQARGGRWQPVFGARGWKLRQREPLLPNLLTPWRAQTRLRWRFDEGLDRAQTLGGARLPVLRRLPRVGVGFVGGLIFIGLPLCLFVWPDLVLTLAIVAGIYLCSLAVLVGLRRDARTLGIDRRLYLKLCVECITCPPFCINAVRKLSLMAPAQVGLSDVLPWLKTPESQSAFKRQIGKRLLDQIDLEPEDSPHTAGLLNAMRALNLEEEME